MNQHGNEHGAAAEHGAAHLPDPSPWPLIIGLAALLLGAALVVWSRGTAGSFAGPLLGVAIAFTLLAVGGWVTEDSRMRRKAEVFEARPAREARYTQVITFGIPEGQLESARSKAGLLDAIDRSDSALRDLAGFQDLRIVVSAAETGTSQVLVETTWSGRQELATYDQTRQTLLDLLNEHPGEVAPGSVQVFDMEAVRDTKDVAVRFGMGAAVALLGSLVLGGFMLGAGLTLFESEAATAPVIPGGNGGAVAGPALSGTDNKFNKTTLEAPPNTEITFTFENKGKNPHNVHFYDRQGGQTLAPGAEGKIISGGQTDALKFTTPGPGSYFFQCDVHPTEMSGTFAVKEGAAVPGGGAPAGGGTATAGGAAAEGATTVTATDNKFDRTSLTADANKDLSVTLKNNGKNPHNIHFFDKKGGQTLAPGAEGKIIAGAQSETLKFTVPAPGKYYYQCDVHQTEMFGDLTAK